MPPTDAVLVDTHALLWWQAGSPRLSVTARGAIDAADAVMVSPISCWEVAMLLAKGRIALDRPVAAWVNDLLGASGPARSADLTPAVGVAAGELDQFHGDPADRLIYATAMLGRIPLVTKDRRLREFAADDGQVSVVW
jgi:PIN domain nuclease of toxin-antitoxin system